MTIISTGNGDAANASQFVEGSDRPSYRVSQRKNLNAPPQTNKYRICLARRRPKRLHRAKSAQWHNTSILQRNARGDAERAIARGGLGVRRTSPNVDRPPRTVVQLETSRAALLQSEVLAGRLVHSTWVR